MSTQGPNTLSEQLGFHRPIQVPGYEDRFALSGLATGALVEITGTSARIRLTCKNVPTFSNGQILFYLVHQASGGSSRSLVARTGSGSLANSVYVGGGDSAESFATKLAAAANAASSSVPIVAVSDGATVTMDIGLIGPTILQSFNANFFAPAQILVAGSAPCGVWRVVDPLQLSSEDGWEQAGLPGRGWLPTFNISASGLYFDVTALPDAAGLVEFAYDDSPGNEVVFSAKFGGEKVKKISANTNYNNIVGDLSSAINLEEIFLQFSSGYPSSQWPIWTVPASIRLKRLTMTGYNGYGPNSTIPSLNFLRLKHVNLSYNWMLQSDIGMLIAELVSAGLSNGYLDVSGGYNEYPYYEFIPATYTYNITAQNIPGGDSWSGPNGVNYEGPMELTATQIASDASNYWHTGAVAEYVGDDASGVLTVSIANPEDNYYANMSGYDSNTPIVVSYPGIEELIDRGWQVLYNEYYNPY